MQARLLTPIRTEFEQAKLGDGRLNRRLLQIAEAADRAPGASLPVQAGSGAALEAIYRFFGNADVSPEAVFESHALATADRASKESEVIVVHDTTEFRFGGERPREGLGRVSSDKREGFLAHFSLCVSRAGEPLGSLGCLAWARHGPRKGRCRGINRLNDPDRESLRWHDAALLTGKLFTTVRRWSM